MYEVKQDTELHVITPNETGIFVRVLATLANAGVNLKALSAFSDKDKGIFRIITTNNKKAATALKALGFEVTIEPVVTVMIDDRIGAGAEIGALLGNAIIDIIYCYGSSIGVNKALLVFKTSDDKKAVQTLR